MLLSGSAQQSDRFQPHLESLLVRCQTLDRGVGMNIARRIAFGTVVYV